jgi:glycosyltransferase involved in cell wall biosynthesis
MENRPLLEVFTTSFQESKTIKELIDFYRERIPGCLITVQDNMSTDNTKEICEENGVKFIQFDTNDKMDEKTLIHLRNTSWKNSTAKFIIVCDSDELVDVTEEDLMFCDKVKTWNVCKCDGVELFGHDEFFKDSFYGVKSEGYSKTILFHKDSINSMNFAAGSHTCHPTPNEGHSIVYTQYPFKLYHTKWQNYEEGIKRQNFIKLRGVSDDSKSKGWNFHYSLPDSEHKKYFDNGFEKRIKIR